MERTISTIAADSAFDTVKAEIIRAIDEMKSAGKPVDHLPAELIKLGAAIGMPIIGPTEVLDGLVALTRQLANEFPDEWRFVQSRNKVAGHA